MLLLLYAFPSGTRKLETRNSDDLREVDNTTVIIIAGSTYGSIDIQTISDKKFESDETFSLIFTGDRNSSGGDLNNLLFINAGKEKKHAI